MITCRKGHALHANTVRIVVHSRNGKRYQRCLICHAARQQTFRVREMDDRRRKRNRLIELILNGGTA